MKREAAGQQMKVKEIDSYVKAVACTAVDSCREFIFFFSLPSWAADWETIFPYFSICCSLQTDTARGYPAGLFHFCSFRLSLFLLYLLLHLVFQLLFISFGFSLLLFSFKFHLLFPSYPKHIRFIATCSHMGIQDKQKNIVSQIITSWLCLVCSSGCCTGKMELTAA